MKNNLTPTTITDKNGRVTTVYRKSGPVSGSAAHLPPVSLPQSEEYDPRDKYRNVVKSMSAGMGKMRAEKEAILVGGEEKDEIINRLSTYFGIEDLEKLMKVRDQHYVDSFRMLERLIAREPFHKAFAKDSLRRFETLTGAVVRNWSALADRHYDSVLASPIADDKTTFYFAQVVSAGLHESERRQKRVLTEQQEYNYLILNLAARESELEGEKIIQGSGWGLITCRDNQELTDFAMECTDIERLHRVCEVIKNSPVKRMSEVFALADGEVTTPLSNGAL